jgi:predicted transcriptional regulator of viral defense system
MIMVNRLEKEFKKKGGVLRTSTLNELGFSSRQINRLMGEGVISRIKHGFYELTDYIPKEEVVIARLFPEAVIFLESALLYYGYTDRIPSAWQIAVDKNSQKTKYDIDYPLIEPFYLKPKFIDIGIDIIKVDGVKVKIYDRDRTICDALRYEKKLEGEVFNNAIQRYVGDHRKNIRRLFEYADIFNIKNKTQTYIGVRLQ